MGADEGQEREEEKRNRDAALEQRQCIRTKKRDRKRELFLATLGYVSFLSFSYFSTLSRFSFSRLFAQLRMIVGRFFVGICGKKKVTMNEEKRGQAEKCLGE